jgi:hypothetical protein
MNFRIKSLNNLAPKYKAAIEDISDERDLGDGFWIYLKPPFFNPQKECRIIHEETISECLAILKSCVNNPMTEEEYFSRFNKQK